MGDLVVMPQEAQGTLALVSRAEQALAEAQTLTDFRKVMEGASVATDAAQRAAKLMQAQGMTSQVVEAAERAARRAAAVKIAAQAGAGRVLKEMAEKGERLTHRPSEGVEGATPYKLEDLGLKTEADKWQGRRWQQIADIPDNVRAEYVDETKTFPTTAGLLRYAAQKTAEPKPEPEYTYDDAMESKYKEMTKALEAIAAFRNPGGLAAYVNSKHRRTKFAPLLEKVQKWITEAQESLG